MTEVNDRVRRGFYAQGLMQTFEAELTLTEPGECHVEVPFSPRVTQQHGFFHGGVTAAIADNAAGFAAYSLMAADEEPLTVEFKISFVAPARGEAMVARARVLKNGRRLKAVETKVYARREREETLVAAALATISSTRSVEAPGAGG